MKIIYAVIPMLAFALAVGCQQKPSEAPASAPVAGDEPAVETDETTAPPVELVPVLRKAQSAAPRKTQSGGVAAKSQAAQQSASGTAAPLKGTIYVETDGAQGRVWGHVTMNGDRGTGTIHDWDENTWAVNVTRHGNELFAVDQNSRLYVFKLKQNKTQQ